MTIEKYTGCPNADCRGGPENMSLTFVHIFAKYWPIFKFFSQVVIKWLVNVRNFRFAACVVGYRAGVSDDNFWRSAKTGGGRAGRAFFNAQ